MPGVEGRDWALVGTVIRIASERDWVDHGFNTLESELDVWVSMRSLASFADRGNARVSRALLARSSTIWRLAAKASWTTLVAPWIDAHLGSCTAVIVVYAALIFDEVDEILETEIQILHLSFHSLGILFLSFRIALQKLNKSTNIVYFFVLTLHVTSQLLNLLLKVERAQTRLRDTFELNLQKGHVGASIGVHFEVRGDIIFSSRQILQIDIRWRRRLHCRLW